MHNIDLRVVTTGQGAVGLEPHLGDFHDHGPSLGSCAAGKSRILDRKSTRLNSSHVAISYAVFCLKKKRNLVQAGDLPTDQIAAWHAHARSVDRASRKP